MGQLRQKMDKDLKLRGYSLGTRDSYLRSGIKLAQHFDRSPKDLDLPDVEQFLLHLIEEKNVGPAGHKMYVAGLKFLYGVTLERPEVAARLVFPKVPYTLARASATALCPWAPPCWVCCAAIGRPSDPRSRSCFHPRGSRAALLPMRCGSRCIRPCGK